MKHISILTILIMLWGCSPRATVKPCQTLGKKCERSIKKVGDDCFEISVNRANLNKINKGGACLKIPVQTFETTEGWSNFEFVLSVGGAAAVFFLGGLYVGGR